ncbi:MAG: LuxR C-terminal-related transcriptional regulator [Bacteroidales bacterium]|jgi:DNA-binding CsgD family transcriptional regulator|nr:LuxR C-terminal-related transcriptional regulator [Bacteroidales bacterium]
MLVILYTLVFIISLALTVLGIILSSRLRNRQKQEIFSPLLYFQVFIFTFGFYGIWGQVFISRFLSEYISADLITRVSNFALLMGLPFLIFAWLMLIQFAAGISGRKTRGWSISLFLTGNFAVLFVIGYCIAEKNIGDPLHLIIYYFILMNIIWTLLGSYLIHLPLKGRAIVHEHDRKITSPLISVIGAASCIPLLFYSDQSWIALIFIFLFFAGNTFLPVYFSYGTLVSVSPAESEEDPSFESFCRKYEVSPRESDIIMEICNGLSNKEISEKLFISLQTVKDHTHRIYIKTNVKSRVQLINLVKEEGKT